MRLTQKLTRGLIICATGVVAITAGGALAHMGATGIVKQRMDGMVAIKENMAAIGAMIKGTADFDAAGLASNAKTIARHGSEIRNLFPDTPESRQKVSEATERVWQEKDRFNAMADEMVVLAKALAASAQADDMPSIQRGFGALGKSCSACHQDFRRKK